MEVTDSYMTGVNHGYALQNKKPEIAKDMQIMFNQNIAQNPSANAEYQKGFLDGIKIAMELKIQKDKKNNKNRGMSM